jgi:hypothetical protein
MSYDLLLMYIMQGLGEKFDDASQSTLLSPVHHYDGRQFDFKDTIARVTREANAVVPIISFKEIPKPDWKRLPEIISSGIKTRASMVICTHFDQVRVHLPDGSELEPGFTDINGSSATAEGACCPDFLA